MKRLILTIMACLTLFGVGHAQVSDIKLGYSGDQLPSSSSISWNEANSDVSAAIFIPAGTIGTYAENYISGVNAGLASKLNLESLTVWVRSELSGANLAEQTVSIADGGSIIKGWNTINFDTPYLIPQSTEGLYIGYTFHQKGTAFGVAALDTPIPNAFFVKFGSGDWEDRCDQGTACIQALIRGDKLPKVNLALTSLTLPETYIKQRGNLEIGGIVKNLATYVISGFDVCVYVDGKKVGSSPVEMALAYGESGDFNTLVDIPADVATGSTLDITVTIENIPEGTDEDTSDNSLSGTVNVVKNDFTHRVLVEEFTTENCPNCPRVGNYLHDILEKPEFADNVIAVCHHSGYYTDWLTAPFDAEYMWLFNNNGSTYAPAIMIDRITVEGTNTAVFNPTSQANLENSIKQRMKKPALVSLDITMDQTEVNKLNVNVKGECSAEQLCENPRITVFVVEDNITARNQAGASSGWVHQHVNRAVNATWGEPLEFVNGEYNYDCTLNLKNDWKRDNLKIVAFISNYNQADAKDCPIFNAAQINYVTPASVNEIIDSTDDREEYYNLQGVRVANPESGIYIRRCGDKVEKIIVK